MLDYRAWPAIFLRLVPYMLVIGLLVAAGFHTSTQKFAQTALKDGRPISEVALFSPQPIGLIQWGSFGTNAHAFVGIVLPLCILASLLCILIRLFKRKKNAMDSLNLILLALFSATSLGIILLALGPNGPFGGALYMKAREYISVYKFMRMTNQIYCLLPTTLALANRTCTNRTDSTAS